MNRMKDWLLRCCTKKVMPQQKAESEEMDNGVGKEAEAILPVDEAPSMPVAEVSALPVDEVSALPVAEVEVTDGQSPAPTHAYKEKETNSGYTDDLHLRLQKFLESRYELRFNVLTEEAEFRRKPTDRKKVKKKEEPWHNLDKRWQNTLVLEARAAGICVWDVDMGRILNSHLLPDFHPMLSYMQNLPEWDGIDRVTPLAHRISTDPLWEHCFATWLRALAAQWEGRQMQTANMLAPILISRQQGRRKSTFCRMLVPDELQSYYLDRFDPNAKANAEQRLANTALINMDEFDRYPASVMPSLKNYMQMNSSNFRKMRTNRYLNLPRVASFIGTSNRRDLLTDPTGSRRFLCWEVDRNIDCTPISHDQLFAQLRHQLDQGMPTYLTSECEREVEEHNQAYQRISPEQDAFLQCFRVAEDGEEPQSYSASHIFTHLCKEFPQVMRGITANSLSRSLTALGIVARHTNKGNFYQLVPIMQG